MATTFSSTEPVRGGARVRRYRLFVWLAVAMAATIVAGFSMQLAMGRSSFAAPWPVHLHALVFMGWVAFYVTQTLLAAGVAGGGSLALHRRLGWFGAGWAAAVVVIGVVTTAAMVRRGGAPFFFTPAYFLFMNSLSVLVFGVLVAAAIRHRRTTDSHNRLMVCAMAVLTGPAIGRLLPMPFLIPYAGLCVFAVVMLFPIAGMIADRRTRGRVHPAWWAGVAVLVAMQVATEIVPHTAPGLAVYRAVTRGGAGEGVAPLAYPPFPPAPPPARNPA